jgi:ubiquitin carboxyl-terminal hydrolase 7
LEELGNKSNPNIVATHRFTAEEGDWGFTRFYDLRSLFADAWEGKSVPLVQDEEANVTAYVRVVKDPTGVLWHSFQKCVFQEERVMQETDFFLAMIPRRKLEWLV